MTPEEPNVTSEEPNGTSEAFEPERGRAGGDEPPDPVPPAATPDEVLDCLGQRCPLPVIALAVAADLVFRLLTAWSRAALGGAA